MDLDTVLTLIEGIMDTVSGAGDYCSLYQLF